MVRRTRVGRSPRGRNPSIRVQIPASPCLSVTRLRKVSINLSTSGRRVPLPYPAGYTEALSTYCSGFVEPFGFSGSALHRMD